MRGKKAKQYRRTARKMAVLNNWPWLRLDNRNVKKTTLGVDGKPIFWNVEQRVLDPFCGRKQYQMLKRYGRYTGSVYVQ